MCIRDSSYTDDIVQVKTIVGEVAEVLSGEDMQRPERAEKLPADNACLLYTSSLLQDFFETMQVLFAPIAEEYEKAKCSAQPDDILRAINAEDHRNNHLW